MGDCIKIPFLYNILVLKNINNQLQELLTKDVRIMTVVIGF